MNRTTPSTPSYRIYAVERRHTKRANWTDIGTAFTHRDGKGFDLELQTMPLGAAELVVRPSAEKRCADGSLAEVTRQKCRPSRKAGSILNAGNLLSAA